MGLVCGGLCFCFAGGSDGVGGGDNAAGSLGTAVGGAKLKERQGTATYDAINVQVPLAMEQHKTSERAKTVCVRDIIHMPTVGRILSCIIR